MRACRGPAAADGTGGASSRTGATGSEGRAGTAGMRNQNRDPRPHLTLESGTAPEQLRQLADDRQAQAAAAKSPRVAAVDLRKGLEEPRLAGGRDADPRIAHGELEPPAPALGQFARHHLDLALAGELHGIVDEVHQHLAHPHGVALVHGIGGALPLLAQGYALLPRLPVEDGHDLARHLRGAKAGTRKMELPRLDARQIEHVVELRKQHGSGTQDRARAFVALRARDSRRQEDLRHAEHAVHGRAQLVAHRGQEPVLGEARRLRGVARALELFDEMQPFDAGLDRLRHDLSKRPGASRHDREKEEGASQQEPQDRGLPLHEAHDRHRQHGRRAEEQVRAPDRRQDRHRTRDQAGDDEGDEYLGLDRRAPHEEDRARGPADSRDTRTPDREVAPEPIAAVLRRLHRILPARGKASDGEDRHGRPPGEAPVESLRAGARGEQAREQEGGHLAQCQVLVVERGGARSHPLHKLQGLRFGGQGPLAPARTGTAAARQRIVPSGPCRDRGNFPRANPHFGTPSQAPSVADFDREPRRARGGREEVDRAPGRDGCFAPVAMIGDVLHAQSHGEMPGTAIEAAACE